MDTAPSLAPRPEPGLQPRSGKRRRGAGSGAPRRMEIAQGTRAGRLTNQCGFSRKWKPRGVLGSAATPTLITWTASLGQVQGGGQCVDLGGRRGGGQGGGGGRRGGGGVGGGGAAGGKGAVNEGGWGKSRGVEGGTGVWRGRGWGRGSMGGVDGGRCAWQDSGCRRCGRVCRGHLGGPCSSGKNTRGALLSCTRGRSAAVDTAPQAPRAPRTERAPPPASTAAAAPGPERGALVNPRAQASAAVVSSLP